MQTILDTISDYAKQRVIKDKEKVSEQKLISMCDSLDCTAENIFKMSLMKKDISFICEVKKASPSKGIIAENFDYIKIAQDYEKAGADCISCLTEPKWFMGSDKIFTDIRKSVSLPMLRKDFVVDKYQIYQAKTMGADAVLLICSVLGREKIEEYLSVCKSLGLVAVVEAHDETEISDAVLAGAEIIGVNNRNLKNFTVDISNSQKLRSLVPEDIIFIAESGIKTADDIKRLKENRVDAVLIGETLMRAENKKSMLDTLKGIK